MVLTSCGSRSEHERGVNGEVKFRHMSVSGGHHPAAVKKHYNIAVVLLLVYLCYGEAFFRCCFPVYLFVVVTVLIVPEKVELCFTSRFLPAVA